MAPAFDLPGGPGGEGRPKNPALLPAEQSTFGFRHKHSGLAGDGAPIPASFLDTRNPFIVDKEPVYTPQNAPTSGRLYRIQIVEVTDPVTQQISPVIQVVPVTPTP